jgi:hypothetical protein
MADTLDLPTWCKILIWFSLVIELLGCMAKLYNAGKENRG